MIAYFSTAHGVAFWEDHWAGHSVEELLQVARRSPLTALIESALPSCGRILEAGCGLGQYVLLLRERGHLAIGVDRSFQALRECLKSAPGALLAAMDLRELGFGSGVFSAYVSLGVVEHDPEGPDAVLREARRLLAAEGVLILSVPYVNGVRRLGAWWIDRRNRRVQQAGGRFYQFAFSRREARQFIERNGFRILMARPYDPARLLSGWRRRLGGGARRPSPVGPEAPSAPLARLARRLLYTRLGLDLFGHMILFVAVKAG